MRNRAGAVPEEGAGSGVPPSRATEERARPGGARARGGGDRGERGGPCVV